MIPILFIGCGFVFAVLWLDLKFDWLAVPYRNKQGVLSEDVLAPMGYYYRYVTGKPIVLATTMLLMIITMILEIVQASVPAWAAWASLVLFGTAITRSAILVIPTSRRFGLRTDTLEKQTSAAHTLLSMHLIAFILAFLMTIIQVYATIPLKINSILFICIGFLIGFDWINVKIEWLVFPYRGKTGPLPEEVLAPIALFHRYLRSAAEVGITLSFILITLILEIVQNSAPAWLAWISLALLIAGIVWFLSAGLRSARRLGTRVDDLEKQTALARGLLPMHVFVLAVMLIIAVLQVYNANL